MTYVKTRRAPNLALVEWGVDTLEQVATDRVRINAGNSPREEKRQAHALHRAEILCAREWVTFEMEWAKETGRSQNATSQRDKEITKLLLDPANTQLVARFIWWYREATLAGVQGDRLRTLLLASTTLADSEFVALFADPQPFFADPQGWVRRSHEKATATERDSMEKGRAKNQQAFAPLREPCLRLVGLTTAP